MDKLVNIGQSIQIKGELTGNEDLIIDGKVDGKINLDGHSLTIGANGRITAEIRATSVKVLGQVVGNITASDRIEITPSGSVEGDLQAPRVALEDGATFRGAIDMKPTTPAGSARPAAAAASATPGATSGAGPAAARTEP